MKPGTAKTVDAIIHAALRGELDETHARRLHDLGPEAAALAIPSLRSRTRLAASKHIAEQDTVIATLQRQRETQQPSPLEGGGGYGIGLKPGSPCRIGSRCLRRKETLAHPVWPPWWPSPSSNGVQ